MTTYLIVSGVTLVGAFIVGALIYVLVMFSGLKRACEGLRENLGVHKTAYEVKVANIYRDLDVKVSGIYRDMDDKDAVLKKDLEEVSRDHVQAMNAVYQEIETKVQTLVNQQEKAQSDLDRRINDTGSYVDSRFDQLLNKVEKEYVQKTPTNK
jgi:phosphoglycerate-specific signal transduction histidine kinase